MTNLIEIDFKNPKPIKLDDQVNLRDVFNVLVAKGAVSSKQDYNTWANRKLIYYGENTDYFTFRKNAERKNMR